MKISFEIDINQRKINFFVKRGELYKWVEDAVKKYPDLESERVAHKGSQYISLVTTRVIKEICEKNKIKEWEKFTPNFVMYKERSELPLPLR